MMEWEDGKEYPVIRLDISSDSHPFYTGRQKFAAADGRVGNVSTKSLVLNQINEYSNLLSCLHPIMEL